MEKEVKNSKGPKYTLIPRNKIHLGRIGIENTYNSCSLISAVSLLSHIPDIVQIVVEYYIEKYLRKEENNQKELFSFPYTISKIMWCLWASEQGTNIAKEIQKLHVILFPDNPWNRQEDAVECFVRDTCHNYAQNLIISHISSSMFPSEEPVPSLESSTTLDVDRITTVWNEYKKRVKNKVRESFYGMMYTHQSCSNCKDHYTYEYFNCIPVPLIKKDKFVFINLITYSLVNQLRGKKVISYYSTNIKPYRCRLELYESCENLYNQMAMELKLKPSELDLILFRKDKKESIVLDPSLSQTSLVPNLSSNFNILCLQKPNSDVKPVAIQPVIWRYVINGNKRDTDFLRPSFPFFIYCDPDNTCAWLFHEISLFLNHSYHSQIRHFQERLHSLMPLVYFDVVQSQKRSKPSGEEGKSCEGKQLGEGTLSREEKQSVEVKCEEKLGDGKSSLEEKCEERSGEGKQLVEGTLSGEEKPSVEVKCEERSGEAKSNQLSSEEQNPSFITTEQEVPIIDPISWMEFDPKLPIFNVFYYQIAKKKNPQGAQNWMRFLFRKDHLNTKISQFIVFDKHIKSLYLILDVDEGKTPLLPDDLGDNARNRLLKEQEYMIPIPDYSADCNEAEVFNEEETDAITLEYCLHQNFVTNDQDDKREECPFCHTESQLIKHTYFCSFPQYLLFHLQRASFDCVNKKYISQKIITNISYPITDLDMTPYSTTVKENKEEYMYDLVGVLCHSNRSTGNHFYTMCRDDVEGAEKWVKYDDDSICFVSTKEVVTPEAYCLLYVKKDYPNASAKKLRELILTFAELHVC